MQKEQSRRWWDDYHTTKNEQEWIAQPRQELLELILQHYEQNAIRKCNSTSLNILEIGCGTSTLVRDVKKYFEQKHLEETRSIVACGTDVSQVCIDFNRQRDAREIIKATTTDDDENNLQRKQPPFYSCLQYEVLDVVIDGEPPLRRDWDLIFDKGCLDTFMFRSQIRGKNENHLYPIIVRTVLENVHRWLKPHGMYMLISPRSKIKAVRDFNGFSSVHRHILPKECMAELDGKRKGDTANPVYMYICIKRNDYEIGVTPPFNCTTPEVPKDDSKCQRCGITFHNLRKGESIEGRGTWFWTRQWIGHLKHCS
jgi:SAM-dependent methyltransferase